MATQHAHTDLAILADPAEAKKYLAMQQRFGRFYLGRFLKRLDAQNKSGRFLEVGAGPGYQTVKVAKAHPDAHIRILEPSPAMIAIAQAYFQEQGVADRIDIAQGVVEDAALIGELGAFDLIYSSFSLHHWQEAAKGIANLSRALAEDGVLLLYDFARNWLTTALFSLHRGAQESVIAAYTPRELESLLKKLGISRYTIEKEFPYLCLRIAR